MAKSGFNNLSGFIEATTTNAGNIAGQKVIGNKRRETVFSASVIGSGKNSVGFVQSANRNTISQQGAIIGTGIATDISLQGSGMMAVTRNPADPNSETVFTRSGSFRQDKSGFYTNSGGLKLLGYLLDDNGNIPTNSSLLSSLTPVNIRSFSSKPEATTTVAINMNLDASKTALKGAGELLSVNRGGANANLLETDIIVPEILGTSSLKQGDQITLTSTPPNTPKTFEFGGISISRDITKNGGFYGATTADAAFAIVAGVPGLNQIQNTAGIKITVDGNETILNVAINPNSGVGQNQFNSLNSLAARINGIAGLTARVQGGRLYVASIDGNQSITFAENNGGNLVSTLGLSNVAANPNPNNISRFATLSSLRQQINANNVVTGLAAERGTVNGSLDIHALLATSGMNINGNSFGVTSFSSLTLGRAFAPADGGADRGRATVTINSPAHGLQPGDLVNVTGTGIATATDGHYMVSSVNDDSFTINLAALPAAFPVAAAPATTLVNGTWQKIAGEKFADVNLGAGTITNANAGGNNIEITNNAHGLQNGDVIYVSGLGLRSHGGQAITVPDGYYVVANRALNTFQITATANAGAGVEPAAGNFSYHKVGTVVAGGIAGGIHFDNRVLTTTGNPGSNQVKMFIADNNYNVNDWIKVAGLPALNGQIVVDGITITNNTIYRVVARDQNSVTFEVVGGGVATNGDEGATAAADVASYAATDFTVPHAGPTSNLGANFRVDDYSRTFSYLNFLQDKFDFAATYDAGSSDKSLSGDNQPAGQVFNHAFTVIDSLGAEHQLILKFAKLNQNLWAAEVASVKGANKDNFDAIVQRVDGQIATGELAFDNTGALTAAGNLNQAININWENGSATSIITIDWLNLIGAINGVSSAITQFAGQNDVRALEQNGHTAGVITEVNIDENGFVVGSFNNGTPPRPLYQIPIITFANIDGLEATDSDTYRATIDSGPANLKLAGSSSTTTFIAKAVESSNTDVTTELLEISSEQNAIQSVARTLSADNQNFKTILSELSR